MRRRTVLALPLAAAAQEGAPEASISNGLITAELQLPDPERGYYRGTRFDWSGQVRSLKFQAHEYFGRWFEKYDPKSHDAILGPVEEFVAGESSVGYEEAEPGGVFVRIGVGAVRKPEEQRFQRFRTYEIVDPGAWSVNAAKDSIQFKHELKNANGYAYRYVKTMRLPKGRPELIIDHVLENRGQKAIRTAQYNHNFFVIDGQPTGPDSVVEFPFTLEPRRPVRGDAAEVQKNKLVYKRELRDGESFYGEFTGFGKSDRDYDIRVENAKTGAGVRIRGDRPLSHLVFWSIRSTFCPEPYIELDIAPGKRDRWTYTYSFYVNAKA